MLNKICNLLLISAICLSIPFNVSAVEVFKDDSTVYTLEKIEFACSFDEGTFSIMGIDNAGNYIHSNFGMTELNSALFKFYIYINKR